MYDNNQTENLSNNPSKQACFAEGSFHTTDRFKSHMNNADSLIERIITSISNHNIQNYLLYETITDSEELFFIKKDCVLKRNKLTTKCEVTIYHDFEEDGKDFRGSSGFIADLNMSTDELDHKILSAYSSAMSVKNPYYKLPASDSAFETPGTISDANSDNLSKMNNSYGTDNSCAADSCKTDNSSAADSCKTDNSYAADSCKTDNSYEMNHSDKTDNSCKNKNLIMYTGMDIADIIYKNDTDNNAFINSLEIFVTGQYIHIINSNGVNVSYNDMIYSGEYVVQAKEPNDVELYQDFKYSYLDRDIKNALSNKLKNSFNSVRARSVAIPVSNIQNRKLHYDRLILEGSSVYDLFCYYLKRLDASMIYPEYSHYRIGEAVTREASDTSRNPSDNSAGVDKLNITLTPKIPYTQEGIKLIHANLIKDNIANYITGNARFSHYLGIKPIGTYDSYRLECGKMSVEDMQKEPYLKIVSFSDFQMDELTGQFGGEFRLGYYYDGKSVIPVTNGSISGNINEYVTRMQLSSESQSFYHFDGPLAVSFLLPS